ncbi:hypothetical protein BX070DRAFT_70854 [Coemansia spiralis]|nr:hypothetical protein BX070DRAFT_70854 [Coemansia spiralis]
MFQIQTTFLPSIQVGKEAAMSNESGEKWNKGAFLDRKHLLRLSQPPVFLVFWSVICLFTAFAHLLFGFFFAEPSNMRAQEEINKQNPGQADVPVPFKQKWHISSLAMWTITDKGEKRERLLCFLSACRVFVLWPSISLFIYLKSRHHPRCQVENAFLFLFISFA